MDRKSILILVVCFGLLMLCPLLINRIYPPIPVRGSTNIVGTASTNRSFTAGATQTVAAPTIITSSIGAAGWQRPAEPEQTISAETPEARYVFTSHGGGLKFVELTNFREIVACGREARTNLTRFPTLNWNASLPALALFGGGPLEDAVPFELSRTGGVVRAEKRLTNGLHITKEFRLGSNYTLSAGIRIANRSQGAIALPTQELAVGTATPINRRDTGQKLGFQWYDGASTKFTDQQWFANPTLGCACLPGTPRGEYLSPGSSNIVWAAVHNQFFTIIAVPNRPPLHMRAEKVLLPPPTEAERIEEPRAVEKPFGYQTTLLYPGQLLPPGEEIEWKLDVFAGPKKYDILARLGNNQDLAMNFMPFFGWFARALLLSMNWFHNSLGLAYGAAIIVITVLIKLIFWPLTQASTRSMKRMQALQPQMKALQEKYKEDPKKMNQKLMEFMRENRVSPLGGCLPMLIQIPVFFGLFNMLQSAIELRGAPFLWACDLSQPDTIIYLPGLGFPVNPLPLLMGLSQFWQARLTPPSPGVDPVQQKIFQYMPLIFIVVLYNFPAGLALYWTVQNLLSILQMKLTRAGKQKTPPGAPTPAVGAARKRH